MQNRFSEYYRCPDCYTHFCVDDLTTAQSGYFGVGPGTVCFGRHSDGKSRISDIPSQDALASTRIDNGIAALSFDPNEAIDNLRLERYVNSRASEKYVLSSVAAAGYYLLRPLLPLALRRRILGVHLRRRRESSLPTWPVDTTVDQICETLLLLQVQASDTGRVPIIWFWPKGYSGCAIMTHDVEMEHGKELCHSLMDINESFGMPASFQLVPEKRYSVTGEFLSQIRERGFEVNVQDLNHDGLLFRDKREFLRRAEKINKYAREFQAKGFRSAILFRRQEWFEAFKFEYDMSVPNSGRLDPQRGGCCTVMPYFVGDVLEIPTTTIQDYSLFYILNDYSLTLWKQQLNVIMQKHGLANFIIHPDYITGERELHLYKDLLRYLGEMRTEKNVWVPTPGEVNKWWRERAEMRLVRDGKAWRIEGAGSERASIAYATERDGQLKFSFESTAVHA